MRNNNPEAAGFLSAVKGIPELDSEQAIDALGGSEQLYKMTLLQFMRLLPSNIDAMDEAFQAGKLDSLAIRTHGVKGSLRQLGGMRMARAAEILEMAAKADDTDYCLGNYEDFKNALLRLYARIADALESIGEGTAALEKDSGNISDCAETLARVRAALEDYDSLLATELLKPLTKKSFGDDIDAALTGAVEALESFQPRRALEYIEEITGKFTL